MYVVTKVATTVCLRAPCNKMLIKKKKKKKEPDLWNGSFHPISLHSSIEHIALDSKNIKDSLNFMAKYITNKQVDPAKSNDLENFKGIGEVIWNFISLVYQSK